MVFSIIGEQLNNVEDLAHLRTALYGDKHGCLFNGWRNFLQFKYTPLVLRYSYASNKERDQLIELVKVQMEKARKDIEARLDPFQTLMSALESCKDKMEPYIEKARGYEPTKYTDEFEDWECYDSRVYGEDREIMYEDFWKGGGREGEAILKAWKDWSEAKNLIKERWTSAINLTLSILKHGNDQSMKTMDTTFGRRMILLEELNKLGLELRADSVLCQSFINHGSRDAKDIANTMLEMKFLYDETDYPVRVRNKGRRASIEPLKLFAVKEFIENNPDRIEEVPDTLMAKTKKKFKDIGGQQ